MLRRPKTITSNTKAPQTLKPQSAQQLIRRFHVLQKNRKTIERLLVQKCSSLDVGSLLHDKTYKETYRAYKYPKTPVVHHFDSSLLHEQLVRLLAEIDAETEQRGGLHVYQMASTVGQKLERGGDSLKWLVKVFRRLNRRAERTLEIGSLSPDNAILTSGLFGAVTRIDLNSQHPQILQQDFMFRQFPASRAEKFDMISCSLVVNFVPTAKGRGDMLRRTTQFLAEPPGTLRSSLFLVLPLLCVSNSRYFSQALLREIMGKLGFEEVEYHEAKKVAYWLFDWNGAPGKKPVFSGKLELNPGKARNNFYIDMN